MPAKQKSYKPRLFHPEAVEPFRVSRSKIDMFLECPRCFYLDRRLGVGRPSMPGFTLNIAVDHLLKKEFDMHRAEQSKHPFMERHGIDATPFAHDALETWRNNFKGVEVLHEPTNLKIFGAVDDIWVNTGGELIVVDYKATSKAGKIDLEGGWGPRYKRQLEVYQWLLRGNGFDVSDTGYFVYANGIKDRELFDNKLEFAIEVIPHTGSDAWVEKTITQLKACLMDERVPSRSERCEHCAYREAAGKILQERHKSGVSRATRETEVRKESTKSLF